MAWNNNYNGNRGYGNRSYGRGNSYGNNGYGGGYQQPQRRKAKSGAEWKLIKNGKRQGQYMLMAWLLDKPNNSTMFISAFPLPKGSKYGDVSKSGNKKFLCEITFKHTGETIIKTGYLKGAFANAQRPTGKLYIPDLSIVCSPDTQRRDTIGKGYAGRIRKSR